MPRTHSKPAVLLDSREHGHMPDLTTDRIRQFRRTVYDHFRRHGRDLPWRGTDDPYRILVSEIMLQQTQVDRVVDKYRQFLTRFPTIADLAQAGLGDVLLAWQGLGYNRRGLALWEASRTIMARHGGKIPLSPDDLAMLPGIGPATAASIAAFAFDRPIAFVETNIRSVYLHHFFPGQIGVKDDQIMPIVEKTLDKRSPRRWYSALMDYGTVLKKKLGNPSRRSAHHSRQTRFEGSRRQLRGAVLRIVLRTSGISLAAVARALGKNVEDVRGVAHELAAEGLLPVRLDATKSQRRAAKRGPGTVIQERKK